MADNPFLIYRERLDSYAAVRDGKLSDQQFVDIVSDLDARVAEVDGHGFTITPVVDGSELAAAAGLDIELVIKDETHNVGGSHKARHLFGAALHLLVDEALGAEPADRLAIASCGNAALGASVVARALDRPLDVFVPMWADAVVLAALAANGASINRCERRKGEAGDPTYLRFREAVSAGARSFSVQGTDTTAAFDGGRTLGWELADQVADGGGLDALYVQVGGGALATSASRAMPDVRLHPVQAEGCAPLRRAWDALAPEFDFEAAAADPDAYMRPWDDPHSLATGILDDITYDWLPLLRRTHASGGHPIVAPESSVVDAHRLARQHTTVEVCPTGSAGFAGLLTEPPASGERVGVLFTGIDRS
ncbi:MAG: PLP-dependent lyase/thiolase [Acidimicrobiales bacterium]|nr:PLP-dependent lyase/thiolase [Acidimicrobiales bacterium]